YSSLGPRGPMVPASSAVSYTPEAEAGPYSGQDAVERSGAPSRLSRPSVFVHGAMSVAEAAEAVPADVGDVTYVERGRTTHFVVNYAQGLSGGPALADAVLATCEQDYNTLQAWFGNINIGNLPFNVYIRPGSNGASHSGCSATGLFCDAFN